MVSGRSRVGESMKLGGTTPIMDVILPVYDGAATIEESINSILAQTVSNIRLLVVDDGSTDATPHVLAKIAALDPRLTILTRPNSGIVDALNLGLAHASAPFVARQDADDRSFPDRFACQLAVFEGCPEVVAVSGSCLHIDMEGHRTETQYIAGDPELADFASVPSIDPHLLHPFLMVRREAYQSVGGYRHAFNAEDTDLYWRIRRIGRLRNLHAPLGEMRLHEKSISNASIVKHCRRNVALESALRQSPSARSYKGDCNKPLPSRTTRASTWFDDLPNLLGQGLT
jgi:glycosyltransferase involved in cell wall biosynthesis